MASFVFVGFFVCVRMDLLSCAVNLTLISEYTLYKRMLLVFSVQFFSLGRGRVGCPVICCQQNDLLSCAASLTVIQIHILNGYISVQFLSVFFVRESVCCHVRPAPVDQSKPYQYLSWKTSADYKPLLSV